MDINSIDALVLTLKIKKSVDLKVIDSSMSPTIKPNSYIKITNPQNLKVGDIIVFKRSNYLVIHRIVKYNKKEFIIKGDNNSYIDDDAKKENIVAKTINHTWLSPLIAYLSYYKYSIVKKKKKLFIYNLINWLFIKLCVFENKLLKEIIT